MSSLFASQAKFIVRPTNAKNDDVRSGKNPIDSIFAFAETRPERSAIVGAKLNLNYKTFASTVKRFAAKLRSEGLRPGNVVGLRLRPELQAIAVAAVMHEGAISFAATSSILESHNKSIDFVITEETTWLTTKQKVISINAEWIASLGSINSQVEIQNFASDDSLALLVFSSGTTGVPKGIEFSIDLIHRRTDAAAKNWMPFHPFFAELGLDTVSGIQTYFWCLLHGETFYLPGSSEENLRLIQENGIRSIKTSPSKLIGLVAACNLAGGRLDGLKEVQVAGGLLSPPTAFGLAAISNAELNYLYGSTEAGTVTKGRYDSTDPEAVGQVVADAEVRITDNHGRVLDVGQSGRLNVRTPYQASKYWLSDGSPNSGFHDGWFVPGDTAVVDESGNLRVSGRIDELINAAGLKLNPSLIDSKMQGYRGVRDLASFGYKEPGSLQRQLGLAVVLDDSISFERLHARVKEVVPEIVHVAIVRVSEIPRNALGKPLRGQLAKLIEDKKDENVK